MKKSLETREIEAILLENRFIDTEKNVCSKYGILLYQLRKWKKLYNYNYFIGSKRDWIISALYHKQNSLNKIIEYVEFINRTQYSENEILLILEQLTN